MGIYQRYFAASDRFGDEGRSPGRISPEVAAPTAARCARMPRPEPSSSVEPKHDTKQPPGVYLAN
jgi:hypothetical protein